ncbi:A disintegrin and metalloproteinase with thrombospondin motifs 9-like [Melospiza georgiana]|uniref:A disintegrin and metalloproteinase with thrombospondin motifs 9-like n=1 Tax=Melospiza georgiana TaxID=44398 RepID=UPI0025AC334E|nr:A disintegrin and metalloproteinase with thrombospondin motifs 9-like [Melospiza georgiana]
MAPEGRHVEEENCKHLAKPNVQKKCRGGRCPKWKAGDWGQCSVSCGRGVQRRSVQCHSSSSSSPKEAECDPASQPPPQRDCHLPPCPTHRWAAGEWQACTKTCGEASRFREVLCVDEEEQPQSSGRCEPSERPAEVQSCALPPCEYIWITGEWSECSVTCGKGYRQRLVSCSEIYTGKDHYEYGYQNMVNCPGTQPPNIQPCYLGECPISASWRVGNWGSCSVTCGVGVMHRSVQCWTNDDQLSSLCHVDLKPEERRTCHNVHDCVLLWDAD